MLLLLLLPLFLAPPQAWCAEPLRLVTLDSPPLEYLGEDGPRGANVDISLEALGRLGLSATVEFVPWKRALEMARSGAAHGIIDAGYSPERTTFLLYPGENINLEEVYAFRRTSSDVVLDEMLSAAGFYRVGVGRGHFYGARVDKVLREGRFKGVEVICELETAVKMLLAGRIDLFLGVRQPVEHLLRTMGLEDAVEVVPDALGKEVILDFSPTYLAFSKVSAPPDLARDVERVLREMKRDGTVARIQRRYFGGGGM
ncbi:substrate-binding periplasmic protein [Desulfocurvus sp. DL9XJH121]